MIFRENTNLTLRRRGTGLCTIGDGRSSCGGVCCFASATATASAKISAVGCIGDGGTSGGRFAGTLASSSASSSLQLSNAKETSKGSLVVVSKGMVRNLDKSGVGYRVINDPVSMTYPDTYIALNGDFLANSQRGRSGKTLHRVQHKYKKTKKINRGFKPLGNL